VLSVLRAHNVLRYSEICTFSTSRIVNLCHRLKPLTVYMTVICLRFKYCSNTLISNTIYVVSKWFYCYIQHYCFSWLAPSKDWD
jgi:hypothetical protein